jgi:hypothetical protein
MLLFNIVFRKDFDWSLNVRSTKIVKQLLMHLFFTLHWPIKNPDIHCQKSLFLDIGRQKSLCDESLNGFLEHREKIGD